MRVCWIIMLSVLFHVCRSQDETVLREAEKAYDSKNYKEAIKKYEQLTGGGFRSFELYYNLGNAYYRDKQLGKAIYHYELARKINPNDEDLRINLGIASSKTVDKIDSKENFFISAVKSNVLSTFSTRGWAAMSIFATVLFCACFFLFYASTAISIKKIAFSFAVLFLICAVLSYFLGYSALQAKNNNKFAIVTATETKILNEPVANASLKFSLHEGTKIRVIETSGEWALIRLDNGNEGWLKLADIGII